MAAAAPAYANAAIAEALIAAGDHCSTTGRPRRRTGSAGLAAGPRRRRPSLGVTGRRSGTGRPAARLRPAAHRGRGDRRCLCPSLRVTGDTAGWPGLDTAVGWFLGDNDCRLALYDAATGAGFDALTADGRNANQGAESTLAMVRPATCSTPLTRASSLPGGSFPVSRDHRDVLTRARPDTGDPAAGPATRGHPPVRPGRRTADPRPVPGEPGSRADHRSGSRRRGAPPSTKRWRFSKTATTICGPSSRITSSWSHTGSRHRRHAEAVRLLVGAYFTHEYSLEAAALFNPSIVEHPDQGGLARRGCVVLSLRAVGEGHRSAIEFRTGVVGADGQLRLDEPAAPYHGRHDLSTRLRPRSVPPRSPRTRR